MIEVSPAQSVRLGVAGGSGTDLVPQIIPVAPGLEARAVPLLGVIAYVDHRWSKSFTSALGYSFTKVDNTDFQSASAYRKGEYASGNLLWEPVPHILVGGELLYGKRTDNNGATGEDLRTQLTFKASFSSTGRFKPK